MKLIQRSKRDTILVEWMDILEITVDKKENDQEY